MKSGSIKIRHQFLAEQCADFLCHGGYDFRDGRRRLDFGFLAPVYAISLEIYSLLLEKLQEIHGGGNALAAIEIKPRIAGRYDAHDEIVTFLKKRLEDFFAVNHPA